MAAKPRVLILTPDFPPARGGIQLVAGRIASTMSRLDPLVIAPESGAIESVAPGGVAVHRVKAKTRGHREEVLRLNAASVAAARHFRPDVVLSAHIVTSPAAAAIRALSRVPVVQYLHGDEVSLRPRLACFAVAHAEAVIAVSRHTRELALRAGASETAVHRIPPGVDLSPRHPEPRCQRPTIITVSRLEERYKGHDTLIRALPLVRAQLDGAQWIVIGEGPRREHLQDMAASYRVRSCSRFLGAVGDAERDAWLERAHLFAMPSRSRDGGGGGEGFGIVYLEAGWHELPVVAGDAGGAVDAVIDRETGLLVDADDCVAVADALIRLLRDDELRLSLGARAARRAKDFAWPLITQRVEDVLLAALRAGGNPSRSWASRRCQTGE